VIFQADVEAFAGGAWPLCAAVHVRAARVG